MSSEPPNRSQRWLFLALVLFTFFFQLGSRSLNEPDEGRYAEIAREMIETGNWLVPHLWYMPHLDKPPFTYWAVAASMSLFGQNEWAVRLPLALAGLSGVAAIFLLGRALGGRRAGVWSVLLLQSSLLYFIMARMLTPDIFVTQFITWALYFGWRCWRSLDDFSAADESIRARAGKRCFAWQLAAWAAMAIGFLTKGPIALGVPLAAMTALVIYRRRETTRWQILMLGSLAGLMLFSLIVAPWFTLVFETVPQAYNYMVKGQAMGHMLGTTIKNRQGSPFYFVGILAVGFLPWTVLLGWLWRRAHWRELDARQKEAWLFLSAWVGFTFLLFSLMRAKLPAYILPLFPAISALVSLRWFAAYGTRLSGEHPVETAISRLNPWVWHGLMLAPLLLMAAIPLALRILFKVTQPLWLWPQFGLAIVMMLILARWGRDWTQARCARIGLGLALVNLYAAAVFLPSVETALKSNQTLKPLAQALKTEYRTGDIVICLGRLPQGLPFYAFPSISATNRPYLACLPLDHVPFEFPGNRERLDKWLLPDETRFRQMLVKKDRVLVVGFNGAYQRSQSLVTNVPLRFILKVGQWELFANQ